MRVVRAMGVTAVPSVVLAVLWPTWAGRGAFRCFSVSDSEQRSVQSERSWAFVVVVAVSQCSQPLYS